MQFTRWGRPIRLAREIIGQWQEWLGRERSQKDLRSIGVSGAIRQSQTCAPFHRHFLTRAKDLERRPPPPGRSWRSLVGGNGAPADEFIHHAPEFKFGSLMHCSHFL